MFQLLALNPPARARGSKVRGGKRRAKKSRVDVKKTSSRRRARRSSKVPKHKSPPRIKSGPRRGQFRKRKGARRRKHNPSNPTGKVFSGKVYRPRLKRRKGARKWRGGSFGIKPKQRKRLRAVAHRAYFNNPPKHRRKRSASASRTRRAVAKELRRLRARRGARRSRRVTDYGDSGGMSNPRRKRRKRHSNPRRRRHHNRGRRHARRHSNPRRRRHRNPGNFLSTKVLGPTFNIPVLNVKVAPLEMAFDGAGIAAGASLAIFVPQQAVQLVGPQYAWLNQGWYGVGASALTTLGVAAVGKLASPKVAKLLGLGGALATVLRAAAQLAPVQVRQYVTGPLASPDNFPVYAGAGPVVGKSGGMGGFLTADQIIANEMQPGSDRSGSLRDWVGSGQGMRDWVTSGAGSVMDGSGGESF